MFPKGFVLYMLARVNQIDVCLIPMYAISWNNLVQSVYVFVFLLFDLSVLRGHSFFHPRHNCQWPPTSKDFYPRLYPLHFVCPILIFKKEPVFPFVMLSAKQVNYWYHFYNVFGMTLSLTGDWTRTWSHQSTTRLSTRRWCNVDTF